LEAFPGGRGIFVIGSTLTGTSDAVAIVVDAFGRGAARIPMVFHCKYINHGGYSKTSYSEKYRFGLESHNTCGARMF
jgi:hypothetical protein